MAGRSYSVVQKLAGAALARLRGEEHAASELKVDRATVRRWLKAAPEDGWTLARDLAQARLQEQLASGKVTATQLATVAGVADRNVRYGELIRKREERRKTEAAEPEPREPTPLQIARDALAAVSWSHFTLGALWLQHAEATGAELLDEATIIAALERLAALSESEVKAEADRLSAELWPPSDEPYTGRVLDAEGMPERSQVNVTPSQAAAPALSRPGLVKNVSPAFVSPVGPVDDPLDVDTERYDDHDHPSWRRLE